MSQPYWEPKAVSAAGMLFLPNPTERRGKWKEGWGQRGGRRGGEGITRRVNGGKWGAGKRNSISEGDGEEGTGWKG